MLHVFLCWHQGAVYHWNWRPKARPPQDISRLFASWCNRKPVFCEGNIWKYWDGYWLYVHRWSLHQLYHSKVGDIYFNRTWTMVPHWWSWHYPSLLHVEWCITYVLVGPPRCHSLTVYRLCDHRKYGRKDNSLSQTVKVTVFAETLRLYRIRRLIQSLSYRFHEAEFVIDCFQLLVALGMMAHCLGCDFFCVGYAESGCLIECGLLNENVEPVSEDEALMEWVTSLYWAMTTMTTM